MPASGPEATQNGSAVLHPILPADVLDVGAVVNVVKFRGGVVEFNLDSLEAERLAGSAGEGAVLHPILPADVLDVGAVGEGGNLFRLFHDLDLESFETETFAWRTGNRTVL